MSKLKISQALADYKKLSYIKEDDTNPPVVELDCALGSNPFGCSEAVKKAMLEAEDLSPYPNYPYTQTLEALSTFWSRIGQVKPANFRICGGSIAALESICRIFTANSAVALGFSPQFTDFKACVMGNGGLYETVELPRGANCKFNENTLLDVLGDRHSLVYIDNPNNPTGQVINLEQIEKILKKAEDKSIAVLVDEAYGDFIEDSESAIALLGKYENLLVVRSFSKGYGLAGLRVGYSVCSEELQNYLRKVGMPFTVTSRNAKAAIVALVDQDFIKYTRTEVAKIKGKILSGLTKLECLETDPRTPIMALKDRSGDDLFKKLLKKGVLTESGQDIGLDKQFVRLRVNQQCDRLIEILNSI